jgi:hypothetical protein
MTTNFRWLVDVMLYGYVFTAFQVLSAAARHEAVTRVRVCSFASPWIHSFIRSFTPWG